MKKSIFLICIVINILVFKTQAQNQFEKRLVMHPNSYNKFRSITQFANGNYLGCGYSLYTRPINNVFSGESVYYYLNNNGDTLQTFELYKNDTSYYHQFGLGNVSEFEHSITNSSGDAIAVAWVQGHGATHKYDSDIVLVKINDQGDTLLTKQISHPNDSSLAPYFLLQTFDGNYLLVGLQWSFYTSKITGFVMKVDTNFNVLWRKTYKHPTLSSYYWKALEAPDHGVFLSGSVYDQNNSTIADPILTKIDSAGNILWSQTFPTSSGVDGGFEIANTSDGNFMLTTTMHNGSSNPTACYYKLIKFTNSGTVLTTKNHLHSIDQSISIEQTTNGSLIIAGWLNNSSTQNCDAFVMGIDNNGDSLWYRKYGGINTDYIQDIASTNDGGVILCGETYSNLLPNTSSNAWLLKLDSLGLLITGVKLYAI